MPYQPRPAQRELDRLKKLNRTAGITGSSNKIQNVRQQRNVLNMAKSGSLAHDVGPLVKAMYPSLDQHGLPSQNRQKLTSMYQNRGAGGDPANSTLMKSMGKSRWDTGLTRTGAAHGTDSQWAWPKLHDPFEYWRERCVLPGEYITLLDGPKKVEDVLPGDQALTHMGRYRRVLDTGNQEYEGKVYQLKPRYRLPIRVTADHPIWTKQADGTGAFIHVQDLKPGDMILSPVDRHVEDIDFIDLTEIIDHSDLIIEDEWFTRRQTANRKTANGLPINSCPTKIELTDDFLWLLGLYIAEGSTGGVENKTISFALSTEEFEYHTKVIQILKEITGKDAGIRDHSKYGDQSISIELANFPLSRLLPAICGKGAYNKHFPDWAMFLPENKQKALLRGFFDGDGCYQNDITSCFSSSSYLNDQIVLMMERNGFFPSIYRRTTKSFSSNTEAQNIVLSRTENKDFLRWLDIHQFDHMVEATNKRGRKYAIEHAPEGVWVPVEKVTESDYSGTIYSLTITEDHSYCVSLIATRNTWWFNMEDPDEQREKIHDWSADPNSLVLMGDYSWKKIGEINKGEEVIGWESYTASNGKVKQRLAKTNVLAIKHRIAPNTVKVTMDSGRTMIVTDDHMWANYNYSPSEMAKQQAKKAITKEQENQRISAGELFDIGFTSGQVKNKMGISLAAAEKWHSIWAKSGMEGLKSTISYMNEDEWRCAEYTTSHVGAKLKFIAAPTEELTNIKQIRAAGYIAGMIDGEGDVYRTNIGISQSPIVNSDICQTIEENLNILGLPYNLRVEIKGKNSYSEGKPINRYYLQGTPTAHGTRQAALDLHNWAEGTCNKIARHLDDMFLTANFGSQDTIISVEPLGEGPVVSMQTGLGNYIQDGYASKNCRLMYSTHYLVPGLIDIYTRWPLQDIEFVHKDKKLVQYYEEMFMDGSGLNYGEYLFDVGREFWLIGNALSLGSWHNGIGGWEADELINPNDVTVARNRYLRMYQYHIKVPSEIKKLIDTREPEAEYRTLVELYPDMIEWAREDKEIPVSDVLMKQLKFKTNPWDEFGTPILLRAFRMLMLEESLNAAQDAVADRLYSPLILATLGLPDVDEDGPWIPDYNELQALRDDIGLAVNSDFRLIVHHHGLDIKNAFGREAMPRFDQDFMRVEGNVLKVFGIGPAMLQGGTSSAGTYASSALNHELITNMLETYQISLINFIKSRMEPVAEAQEFYEYETIGGRRVPIMETVLEVDEESGEERIVEKPKLAIPEIKFRQVSLKDENVERQFILQLQQAGFPVSYGSMAVNLPIEFSDELEARKVEKIDMVIAEQQYKKELFQRLIFEKLPCPPELMQEYQMWLAQNHPELLETPENQMLQQTLMMGDPAMGMPTQDISSPPPTGDLNYPGNLPEDGMMAPGGQGGGDSDYAPEESYEGRGASKTASVEPSLLDIPRDERYDFSQVQSSVEFIDEDDFIPAVYGNVDMSTPEEFKQRRVMRVAKGSKVRRRSNNVLTPKSKNGKVALQDAHLEPGWPDPLVIDDDQNLPAKEADVDSYPPVEGLGDESSSTSFEEDQGDQDGSEYNTGRGGHR